MKKIYFIILIIVILIIVGYVMIKNFQKKISNAKVEFGVSFSKERAESLGLDWRLVYSAVLGELGVKFLRLGAYWPEIEPEEGIYDFSDLDWQIDEAESRGVQIILVLGRRLPGWPECHIPAWAKGLGEDRQQEKILSLIKEVIERYKFKESIWAWQVENEPFLSVFGDCPPVDKNFFEKELALAKSLDQRPIIVSESGELSTWFGGARYADILGITIYRAVWNKYFKYFYHPWPPSFYHWKGELVKFLAGVRDKKIIVVELQAEPWSPNGRLTKTPLAEQAKTMSFDRFKDMVDYAPKTGFSRFYFWGVEWWYWMKEGGHPEIWDYAKNLFVNL